MLRDTGFTIPLMRAGLYDLLLLTDGELNDAII